MYQEINYEQLTYQLEILQKTKPLIHHLTNAVVMNDSANVTLAIGALPIMAVEEAELDDITDIASAVVLNIGTLKQEEVTHMLLTGKYANLKHIPIVLDPVGVGASKFRMRTVKNLLQSMRVAVLKGNAFEICALCGIKIEGKGVDTVQSGEWSDIAMEAARLYKCTVLLTGEKDYASDGNACYAIEGGHSLMTKITGSGCMLGSITAAFSSINKDNFLQAALISSIFFKSAGEIAAKRTRFPASFRTALIDTVYAIANKEEKLSASWRKIQ